MIELAKTPTVRRSLAARVARLWSIATAEERRQVTELEREHLRETRGQKLSPRQRLANLESVLSGRSS